MFIFFSKQHLEPITEQKDCCICLNTCHKQTKKCSHPICLDCFYKLIEYNDGSLKCPVCRDMIVDNRGEKQNRLYVRLNRLVIDPNSIPCHKLCCDICAIPIMNSTLGEVCAACSLTSLAFCGLSLHCYALFFC
jgi:hypothetical protein